MAKKHHKKIIKTKKIILGVATALVVVLGLCYFFGCWPFVSTQSNNTGGNSPIPLAENTFFIEDKKDEIRDKAKELGIKVSKFKPVDQFDVTGDGVPEGVYATDRKDQFVMFMQGENNTVTEARRYMRLDDPVERSTVLTLTKSKTANYFVDQENHSLVQYDTADGCDILVYRWEQVKRGFVMVTGSGITTAQRDNYCTQVEKST